MDKYLIDLVEKVKQKPELRGIIDSSVLREIENIASKHNLSIKSLKKSEEKFILKEARSKLRNLVGQFQISPKKRKKLLAEEDFETLLKTHTSTSERIDIYPQIRKLISNINPTSILDLGCGLNPLALATKDVRYIACDINKEEVEIVNKFFKKNKISGNAFPCDIRFETDFPKSDLCLIFKVLDVIEEDGHKLSEELLKKVNSKKYLISFATRKLSGRKMNFPQRKWIEKLFERLNFKYEKIPFENEFFYLASSNY